jgi:hypothetical protein
MQSKLLQSKLPIHLSRRCGAPTRSGSQCQSPAMPNGRCRMHGGVLPGTPKGNRNAFKQFAAFVPALLADIRDVFAENGGAEISSADLIKALVAIGNRPWVGKRGKQLTPTPKKLALMLKPLGITPGHIGPEARLRGYKRWQFEEARYLSPEQGLSSRRAHELAYWYSDQAYWSYSRSALDAGALNAELRAILRKERKCFPSSLRSSSNAS